VYLTGKISSYLFRFISYYYKIHPAAKKPGKGKVLRERKIPLCQVTDIEIRDYQKKE
jgi:hypothetical protein